MQISYQIQAEIAIDKGESEKLKEYLEKMDSKYLVLDENEYIENFCLLSKNMDPFTPQNNFIRLIRLRSGDYQNESTEKT